MNSHISVIGKTILSAALAMLCGTGAIGQSWTTQNANSLGWRFEDLFFIDENTAWACDGGGQIIKTTDGGENWVQQYYNSDYHISAPSNSSITTWALQEL